MSVVLSMANRMENMWGRGVCVCACIRFCLMDGWLVVVRRRMRKRDEVGRVEQVAPQVEEVEEDGDLVVEVTVSEAVAVWWRCTWKQWRMLGGTRRTRRR